jgi:hypothetical protein
MIIEKLQILGITTYEAQERRHTVVSLPTISNQVYDLTPEHSPVRRALCNGIERRISARVFFTTPMR